MYENLAAPAPKDNFTVGIVDDVTFSSLTYGAEPAVLPDSITECQFWYGGGQLLGGGVGRGRASAAAVAGRPSAFVPL